MNEDKPNVKYQWREPNTDHNAVQCRSIMVEQSMRSINAILIKILFSHFDSSLIITSIRGACVGNYTVLLLSLGMVISPFAD